MEKNVNLSNSAAIVYYGIRHAPTFIGKIDLLSKTVLDLVPICCLPIGEHWKINQMKQTLKKQKTM